ncbi:hypothetical protein ACD661_13520 [Legionella lytica]|uniref:Uncharacterized protein n=1 Tax=Legionella lytica TaxID=96232 RepID=A0ABW8DEE5_9GAMM
MKIFIFLLFNLLPLSLNSHAEAVHIQIERQERFNHPVLKIFKKHDVSLQKIRYSADGTCPIFYVTFGQSPRIHNPGAIYEKLLKANSIPYALVDKHNKLMINVGWTDDIPSK